MAPETMPVHQELGRLGRILVGQLFVLFKTALSYSEGHTAIDVPAVNVLKLVREIQRRNAEATLTVRGGHLYLGEQRLKLDARRFEASRYVMQELGQHLIGSVYFRRGVNAADLVSFAYALREAAGEPAADRYGRFLHAMQQRGLVNVEVETVSEELRVVEIDRERLRDDRLKGRLLYRKGVRIVEEVMASAASGHALRLREAKRMVQHLIDLMARQEALLLGFTTLHGERGENHPMNVCLLSLAMGRRLGFSKFQLSELGMAALLHDLGKAGLPVAGIGSGELAASGQAALPWHPVLGVKKLMQLKALDPLTARIVVGAFEHHLRPDHSGYPRLPYRRLSLFGRIVGLADSYDKLVSSQPDGRGHCLPDQALRYLLSRGGKQYDTALLKLLINCVGSYGIGTVLVLESGELAVVVQGNPDQSRWQFPLVRIIADAAGHEVEGEVVEPGAGSGRGIVATVDPARFGLETARYFM